MLDAVRNIGEVSTSCFSLFLLSLTPLSAILPDCQPSSPTQTPGPPPDAGRLHPRLSFAEPPWQWEVLAPPRLPCKLLLSPYIRASGGEVGGLVTDFTLILQLPLLDP